MSTTGDASHENGNNSSQHADSERNDNSSLRFPTPPLDSVNTSNAERTSGFIGPSLWSADHLTSSENPPLTQPTAASNKHVQLGRDGEIQENPLPGLACPFYKYDPIKFGSRYSCSNGSWPAVH
ncbi:hypothetical protein MCOR25_004906 [Pyricularia grisea]|nr:hypothetical protein MCOR25_004906 [Pyricularia grisea]